MKTYTYTWIWLKTNVTWNDMSLVSFDNPSGAFPWQVSQRQRHPAERMEGRSPRKNATFSANLVRTFGQRFLEICLPILWRKWPVFFVNRWQLILTSQCVKWSKVVPFMLQPSFVARGCHFFQWYSHGEAADPKWETLLGRRVSMGRKTSAICLGYPLQRCE